MSDLIDKIHELTPIEEYNGIIYKRDDLFIPYPDSLINGGKVRQIISQIYENLDHIRNDYQNKVATFCPVNSPKGMIISRVCRSFLINCIVFYDSIKSIDLVENELIKQIRSNLGLVETFAELDVGDTSQQRFNHIQKGEIERKFYFIKYGIDHFQYEVDYDIIADQVKNIPDSLDNLIIPAGSGVTAIGILRGIKKYQKKIKNIFVVQLSKADITTTINKFNEGIEYSCIIETGYSYNQKLNLIITNGFELDNIYESKVHGWMNRNIYTKQGKTLFWVVCNFNPFRMD